MDAYDDLMRKKINYQRTEYAENHELICFGLSEHTMEEYLGTKWSDKAEADIKVMSSWFSHENADKHLVRPAYDSKYNFVSYDTRAQARLILGLLFIRELPIKNFYARSTVMYFYCSWFLLRALGKGFSNGRPIVFYQKPIVSRALLNYPDFFWWNLTRVLPKMPMSPSVHKEWRMRQTPVFHQYHRCVYRYRNRKPRYVPWDGTQNQPVMPFLVDVGTDVINGTWKRNANTNPGLK